MTRRVHNSIDKLPPTLQQALTAMLVDNQWPDDFKGECKGKPRYEDLAVYCKQKGFEVSESAIGRFGIRMRMLARMKDAGVIVRDVMKDLTEEKASATQKAAAEMITAHIVQLAAEEEHLTPKQLKEVSQAVRDCMNVSIIADKYIREQLAKKIRTATESTKAKLTKAGVNRKLIQEIIDEHLGVVKA
jgi:hypothetical protein